MQYTYCRVSGVVLVSVERVFLAQLNASLVILTTNIAINVIGSAKRGTSFKFSLINTISKK